MFAISFLASFREHYLLKAKLYVEKREHDMTLSDTKRAEQGRKWQYATARFLVLLGYKSELTLSRLG